MQPNNDDESAKRGPYASPCLLTRHRRYDGTIRPPRHPTTSANAAAMRSHGAEVSPCDATASTRVQSRHYSLRSPTTSRRRHTLSLVPRYVPLIAPLRARSHVLIVHPCTGPSPAVSTRRSIDRRHTPRGLPTAEILQQRGDTCVTESGRRAPVHAVPVC